MKKIKKFLEAALVITVVLALIGMTTTAVFTNKETTDKETLEPLGRRTKNIRKVESNPYAAALQDNILISFGEGDYLHPGITKDPSGNIVVAMTQELNLLDSRMAWSYSTDDGENWEAIEWTEEALDVYNDIASFDFQHFTGLIGTYNDIADGYESFYTITDIADLDTWEFMYWTSGAEDLEYNTISDGGYLEGQYHEMDGPVYMTTQHLIYDVYDIPQCPNSFIIGFDETGVIGGESTFDGQNGPGGTNPFPTAPAVDPDMSNEFMKSHYTWQWNDPEGAPKIVWKKLIPIDGDTDSTDIEFTPYQQYLGEGEHPAIAHNGDNVVVIFMEGANLKCAYSSDDGDTFNYMTIGAGSYPDVCAIGGTFQCAYVSGGNLFTITSEDGGVTWSDPVQINSEEGSVSAEENSIDIHAAGVVWTDTRDGKKNIYFATGGAPPTPNIVIDAVKGGIGITATIKNTGDGPADNFDWNILSEGLVFLGGDVSGKISLQPGESKDISTGFMLGFGNIDITVTVDTVKEQKSAKLLLFFITGL